ncbi:hypothetical protein [Maridesulfovibrio sp.]|uniref:hypothetical protein n=1 Tax=Maridesulfovibrio sp. TaxID=2795000 RepID=UPI003B002EDB
MVMFPFSPQERTEFSDQYYSSIGRLLTLASSFEHSIKALALVMEIKINSETLLGNERRYKRLFSKIYKNNTLFKNLREVCEGLGFDGEVKKTLNEARQMRNFVAHELPVIIFDNNDDTLEFTSDGIRKAAVCLATADIVVSTLVNLIMEQEILAEGAGARVRDSIVEWVCELE